MQVYPSKSPSFLALFCDYYNPEGQCEWHYQPCGAPCMRTCQNPSGHCLHDLHGLEGRLKAELGGAGYVGFLGSGLGSNLGFEAYGLLMGPLVGIILPDSTRSLKSFNLKH